MFKGIGIGLRAKRLVDREMSCLKRDVLVLGGESLT